jgi:hypothetical protein
MRIREYTAADFEALRRMHAAQGFGYPLPDLESPMFISKLVLEKDGEDDDPQREDFARREEADGNSPGAFPGMPSLPGNSSTTSSRVASSQRPSPRILMAILQRLTAETYLLHDPAAGTPRLRWQQFLALHEAARSDARAHGLDDVQAFLPPRVARAFGRRLQRLGWSRDPWPCFSLRIL